MDSEKENKDQRDDFNLVYKKLDEEEISLDDVLNTNEEDIYKNEVGTKMINGNISDLVKAQLNVNKREDFEENVHVNSSNYNSIAKRIPWFNEYKKQTITVTKEKIRNYLRNYKELGKLIKYRKQKIVSGKIKPESNELNINEFQNYDFLEDSVIDEQTFLISTDYKIQEMKFYQKELKMILRYLKKYIFVSYQFLLLKYYLKLSDQNLKIVTNTENIDYMDNSIIEYIYQKLCEEARNGRDKDDL